MPLSAGTGNFIRALKDARRNSKLRIIKLNRSKQLKNVIDICKEQWKDVLKEEYALTLYKSNQPINDVNIKLQTLCRDDDAVLELSYSVKREVKRSRRSMRLR